MENFDLQQNTLKTKLLLHPSTLVRAGESDLVLFFP